MSARNPTEIESLFQLCYRLLEGTVEVDCDALLRGENVPFKEILPAKTDANINFWRGTDYVVANEIETGQWA